MKDVGYVPQLQKNLISIGALEVQDLRGTLGEGVLNMSSGSLVVLKGIRATTCTTWSVVLLKKIWQLSNIWKMTLLGYSK